MQYIPLNVKTIYYLLSSLNDIPKLIKRCVSYNIKSLAVTDPNMYGIMEFYKECRKANIKPIIGLEIEIDNRKLYLYAMNYKGYQNLTQLVFIKQDRELDISILKNYSNDLVCILSFEASNYYKEFKNIYNYIYISYSNLEERDSIKEAKAKLVFINEVLYLDKKDISMLKYLYLIRDSKKEEALNNYKINEFSYLHIYDEVIKNSTLEDIKNMEEIESLCNITFNFNANLLPRYSSDIKFDASEYLKALAKKGLEKRFDGDIPINYKERLKYELEVIHRMGFDNYFLVVWDFIKFSKKNGILSNCRGSAAGSLVSYALGITDIDSIKYNLLFERFLNPERISMPDIDIDFDSERRNEVVSYVINKYGLKRAMPIITFVNLGGRQVLRDVGRILDIPTRILDEICKIVNPWISLLENIEQNSKLKSLLNQYEKSAKLYEIASKLEGAKRQISVHAAGVVISEQELDSYIPLQKYDNYYITGLSMEHLEELGLLKMDFLGLKNLTLLDNVVKDIKEKEKKNINLNSIPLDDKPTLTLFEKAYTDGIFQFESDGMKNFIRKLRPDSFEEVVAAVALYRPGPMDNIDSYIRRKYGKEKIDYIHSDLIKILQPTYGIIVYQEQIMQIANIMADYSLGEADVLRRAMSKKKREVLEQEQTKFIKRSINKGYSQDIATKVYNLILKFANYGFNRSHSVAYALIGYRMAYLKVHYPTYFMSSLLSNVIGNESKTEAYIEECKANNISILKPDINTSEYYYKVEELGIRFSLATIKNVGGITCKEIVKARENKPFSDFFDFVGRTYGKAVTKKALEALIDASCFNFFGYNHNTLHHNLENAINYAELVKNLDEPLIDKPIMEIENEFSREELAKRELDVFGFYLDNHPISKYKHDYHNVTLAGEINNKFDQLVTMLIYVDRLKEVKTKNNELMLFITGSDETGKVDIVLFPKIYTHYLNLEKGQILLIKGCIEKRMSKYQLVVSELEILP